MLVLTCLLEIFWVLQVTNEYHLKLHINYMPICHYKQFAHYEMILFLRTFSCSSGKKTYFNNSFFIIFQVKKIMHRNNAQLTSVA